MPHLSAAPAPALGSRHSAPVRLGRRRPGHHVLQAGSPTSRFQQSCVLPTGPLRICPVLFSQLWGFAGHLGHSLAVPSSSQGAVDIHFILLFSRQGKLRLQKWYTTLSDKERKKITREIVQIVLSRGQRMSSFIDWKELKLVYKRYASLYFCCAVESQDNELLTLEIVHRYVELLDKYFGNVCELDIIFNFEKAYFILDEFIIGGEIQETSKKSAVKAIEDSDMLQELKEKYSRIQRRQSHEMAET
ncbi:AP-1 complex subunit sigma-3 isoform X2 [Myotis myotis]|uniref:AP-1 complex subunit sigma-3 isoform X2 n=1 Tax=Myotis myotis TaxID=51298 RepID=UPI00174E6C55|nr:AP-1 complex subunit sigma-3 isoform X2 [Myotis myotis]XP_036175224.1 AP-1 complex subunit sigma-3 isoform X2 [Myotis myotis]